MSGIQINGLDPRYITGPDLQQYFVNKSTGAPLAGGKLYFYKDTSRNDAKPVYELVQGSNNPAQYSYEPLPNPLTLSAVGTIVNRNGASVALYYFPFDENGEQELYYVECYDALGRSQGVIQFTREAWPFPNIDEGSDITVNGAGIVSNQLINSTFSEVLFVPPSLTINYTGVSTRTVSIAPGWDLFVDHAGTSSVTITQNPIVGSRNLINNPPYTLDFTMTGDLNAVKLIQTFNHNPDWAAANNQEPQGTGWLSGSILIGPGTTVDMQYAASSGNTDAQTILSVTNTNTGADEYVQRNNTIQLQVANSSQNGDVGFDTITVVLPITGTASISNVQVVSLDSNVSNVAYEQSTTDRQVSLMFNYFKEKLEYKPIESYLIGWDFPLNPRQLFVPGDWPQGAADSSRYMWDQTILFQSTASGVTPSVDVSGALKLLSADVGGTQLALIQYLPAPTAIEMLSRRKCVNISGYGSAATVATVSLWYTTTTLPSTIGSNESIVESLDDNGYPDQLNGTWVQVPRSGLSNATDTTTATNAAQFTIPTAPSNAAFNQIPLAGWDMLGNADINNATYFAIVVGTESMPQNDYLVLQSISCQDGDIATVPAPKTQNEVTAQCRQSWRMTFPNGTTPAFNISPVGALVTTCQVANQGYGVPITLNPPMWPTSNPNGAPNITYYSLRADPTAIWTNMSAPTQASWTNSGVASTTLPGSSGISLISNESLTIFNQGGGATDNPINPIGIHYTLDSRPGQ